ncbi:hypothetical protein [Clostridium grantii]|uniref:Uncharacterized protein n=1 Tax=Clostridium grantii DSM 8605 TaxID=1121316 RepID=A0A1M5RR00_9CLOT|nr:hypothetical protein [Clostridium grantii]SHH28541.1 hypothetical protein SAMN02745207_00662 [Clostridium grantii DSM 8605]
MKNLKNIGILSTIVGMILYNVMGNYFGVSGQKLVMYVGMSICLLILLGLVLMKEFVAAFFSLIIILPVVVMATGMYLDNALVVGVGIILLFILIAVGYKILPNFSNGKR